MGQPNLPKPRALVPPQVECPAVTPQVVLQASGHVERFTDLMVTDALTGEPYRADHLLENHLEAILEDKKKPLSAADTEVRGIMVSGLQREAAMPHRH